MDIRGLLSDLSLAIKACRAVHVYRYKVYPQTAHFRFYEASPAPTHQTAHGQGHLAATPCGTSTHAPKGTRPSKTRSSTLERRQHSSSNAPAQAPLPIFLYLKYEPQKPIFSQFVIYFVFFFRWLGWVWLVGWLACIFAEHSRSMV